MSCAETQGCTSCGPERLGKLTISFLHTLGFMGTSLLPRESTEPRWLDCPRGTSQRAKEVTPQHTMCQLCPSARGSPQGQGHKSATCSSWALGSSTRNQAKWKAIWTHSLTLLQLYDWLGSREAPEVHWHLLVCREQVCPIPKRLWSQSQIRLMVYSVHLGPQVLGTRRYIKVLGMGSEMTGILLQFLLHLVSHWPFPSKHPVG